jgi:hypothetical protein
VPGVSEVVSTGRGRGGSQPVSSERSIRPFARRDEGTRTNAPGTELTPSRQPFAAPRDFSELSPAELRKAIDADIARILNQSVDATVLETRTALALPALGLVAPLSAATTQGAPTNQTIAASTPPTPPEELAREKEGPPESRAETASPAQVSTPKRSFTTRQPADAFGSEATPVASAIIDAGGIISKTQAKRAGIYERNGELWDDAPRLSHPTHHKVYNPRGEAPDAAAQRLYDEGLIAEPTVGAMWKALASESKTARTTAKEARQQTAEAKEADKQRLAFRRAASDTSAPAVEVRDLNVGDIVKVGTEPMKVVEIDPDSFDVTLEDGSRFGV